jgi:hypothetical protein
MTLHRRPFYTTLQWRRKVHRTPCGTGAPRCGEHCKFVESSFRLHAVFLTEGSTLELIRSASNNDEVPRPAIYVPVVRKVRVCSVTRFLVKYPTKFEEMLSYVQGIILLSVPVCSNADIRGHTTVQRCNTSLKECHQPFKAYRLLYLPPGLTFKNSAW